MTEFEVRDPDYVDRVTRSFGRQIFMDTLGATLHHIAPGEVTIRLPFSDALVQQHGFMHAGAITSVIDSACGYAALTLMGPEAGVLSVEFKVNLLSPASGDYFLAEARVKKPGRTLTVCTGDVYAITGDDRKIVAAMTATMMAVRDRGLSD
jgi:uncharacterized protein (TIGR00369 family)